MEVSFPGFTNLMSVNKQHNTACRKTGRAAHPFYKYLFCAGGNSNCLPQWSASLKNLEQHHYESDDQQDMDDPTDRVAGNQSKPPHN
jgi:hypothetical protein